MISKVWKFLVSSLEFQKFSSITRTFFFSQLARTILVTKYLTFWKDLGLKMSQLELWKINRVSISKGNFDWGGLFIRSGIVMSQNYVGMYAFLLVTVQDFLYKLHIKQYRYASSRKKYSLCTYVMTIPWKYNYMQVCDAKHGEKNPIY